MIRFPVVDIGELAHGATVNVDWVAPRPVRLLGFALYGTRPWSPDERATKMVMSDLDSEVAGMRLSSGPGPVPPGLWEKAMELASQLGQRTWMPYNDCTVLELYIGPRTRISGQLPLSAISVLKGTFVGAVDGGVNVALQLRNDGPPMGLRGVWIGEETPGIPRARDRRY